MGIDNRVVGGVIDSVDQLRRDMMLDSVGGVVHVVAGVTDLAQVSFIQPVTLDQITRRVFTSGRESEAASLLPQESLLNQPIRRR